MESPYSPTEDPWMLEENNFLRLYSRVLDHFISEKTVSEESIAYSIRRISDSFKTGGSRFQFDEIDFTKWENVCAYLYRYGSHGAGFARNRISNALKNCRDLEVLQGTSHLRVVCLGAGPGNDAVGLCSALAEWKCPDELTITLVDKFNAWYFCAKQSLKIMKEGNFGNVNELFRKSKVKFYYHSVDLPGDEMFNEGYFETLKEADVIVISKLLSILTFKQCEDIIQSLKRRMKRGAFIFLMDQYYEGVWDGFEVIYTWGADEWDIYQSSAEAETRFGADDEVRSKFAIRILRSQSVESREI